MKFSRKIACLALLALSSMTFALQLQGEVVAKPWKGKAGIVETVAQIMKRKVVISPKIRATKDEEEDEYEKGTNIIDPLGLKSATFPPLQQRDPGGGEQPLFSIGANWLGGTLSESNLIPPDSEGAVGPTQYLMCVNGRIKVFDKAGNLGPLNTSTDAFFASVRNGSGTSDPRVRFDRVTQKWYVVMINVSSPNRIMLAVSSGPTITSAASFTFFQFQQDTVIPTGNAGGLFDYPSLGIDDKALYIGGNMFNGSNTGSNLFVVNKASIQGAGPIVVSVFRAISGSDRITPMGVENDNPNAPFGYVIGNQTGASTSLRLYRISNAGTSPVLSSPIDLTGLPVYASPNVVPVLGSGTLDSINNRLIGAQLRTNTVTGVQTLWTSHHSRINSSGVGSSIGDRLGVRWYQFGNVDTTPSLVQAGTVFDSSGNAERRWFGSITMSGQGNALTGMSAGGPTRHAEVTAAYRANGDTLGTMAEQTVITSAFTYNVQSGTQRWGDYSHSCVDPNDNMTMWSVQEYCNATNSWGIRIFSVLAPPPATITTVNPNILSPGNTYTVTVTGTSTGGSAYYDPGAGFPNHLTAAISGTGVTVNSATFNNPTQVTLNLTVDPGAPLGPRNLTITNPDGQSTTATAAITIAVSEVTLVPTSFSTFRGSIQSGDVTSVAASDDIYLRYRPGNTVSTAESPIDVTFTSTSPILTPSVLKVRFETRSSSGNIEQRIRLFNYQTSAFELVDTRQTPTTDTSSDVIISTNASRFVGPTGEVQARISYKQTGLVVSYPYSIFIDQLNWLVTP